MSINKNYDDEFYKLGIYLEYVAWTSAWKNDFFFEDNYGKKKIIEHVSQRDKEKHGEKIVKKVNNIVIYFLINPEIKESSYFLSKEEFEKSMHYNLYKERYDDRIKKL